MFSSISCKQLAFNISIRGEKILIPWGVIPSSTTTVVITKTNYFLLKSSLDNQINIYVYIDTTQ